MNRDEVQFGLKISDNKTAVSNWVVVKMYTEVVYLNVENRQRTPVQFDVY